MSYLILFFLVLLVKKRTRFTLLSPLVLFYLFFFSAIVLSVIYHYYYPEDLKFNIARLDEIDNLELWFSIEVFVEMLIYFSIGVMSYKLLFKINKNDKEIFKIKSPKINIKKLETTAIGLIILDFILTLILYGEEFFFRLSYRVDYNKLGVMVLEYTLLILIFIGALLIKKKIFLSLFTAIFVTMLCIGFGSRMATIYLMVYVFVILLLYVRKSQISLALFFLIPIITLFFGYNISLRFNDLHGLIPYLQLPFKDFESVIENTFFNIYYTFIFGVFATFKTIAENIPNTDYLITSINPLPGFMTDWYEIYKDLRINPYAPFTAIGEIFSYKSVPFYFYFIAGWLFSHSEKVISELFSKKKMFMGFVLFLVISAFIPYSFEYNLRSAVRFLYYSLFIIWIIMLFSKYKFTK